MQCWGLQQPPVSGILGWHPHPATLPRCLWAPATPPPRALGFLWEREAVLCPGFLSRRTWWEPARAPAPLPCHPELLTHRLASQPALRVPQDTAPRRCPLSRAPMPPPQSDLLTAPTIARLIKIIKQQVHFPGPCPIVAARPGAPSLVLWGGWGSGGSRAGGCKEPGACQVLGFVPLPRQPDLLGE